MIRPKSIWDSVLMKTLDEIVAKIDTLIRQARSDEARALLKELPIREVPEDSLWRVSALARRIGLSELSIQWLRPIVRPVKKKLKEPSDEDKAEYAAALIRLGANQEANRLLNSVDKDIFPEALLFLAILKMKDWDYEGARDQLRMYLLKDLSGYEKLVGEMNLAACLLFAGPAEEAESLLKKVLAALGDEHLLLHANSLRLLGNLALNQKKLQEALGYFQKGENLLATVGGLDHFFARKWIAIAEYLIRPSHTDGLEAIGLEAIQRGHWETIRDLDYHRALKNQDSALIRRLYFGTPFVQFRERLQRQFPNVEMGASFDLHLGVGEKRPQKIHSLHVDSLSKPLKGGQSVHRLFLCLLHDFYRPYSIPALFEVIFPGEFYTPKVSEHRVHQAIKRLRLWFKENKLALNVETVGNLYRLSADEPVVVTVELENSVSSAEDHRLQKIRNKLGAEFSVAEATLALGVSRRSVTDLIKSAFEAGELEKIGNGPKTRYRFKNPSSDERLAS